MNVCCTRMTRMPISLEVELSSRLFGSKKHRHRNCDTVGLNQLGIFCTRSGLFVLNDEMKRRRWLGSSSTSLRFIRSITMRDRSKNRKPLQKGRNLSTEAIQTIQALKRASNKRKIEKQDCSHSEMLDQVFNHKVRRLIKSDMIAVLRELLNQNQSILALKVFEIMRTEHWYKPQLKLYADLVLVLGSNGLLEEVKFLIMELKTAESLEPDIEGFNALLKSLIHLNLTGLALEIFQLMKSVECDPDRLSFKILINGLDLIGETTLSALLRKEAQKYYGESLDFLHETEEMSKYLN